MELPIVADLVKINEDSHLQEGDIVKGLDKVTKNVCEYLIVKIQANSVMLKLMAIGGCPLKRDKRTLSEETLEVLIQYNFHLLVDNTNDRDNWAQTIDVAVIKLQTVVAPEIIGKMRQMTWKEFENEYSIFGGLSMMIRNYFGLWRGNYDLMLACDLDKPNADDVSEIILYNLWESVSNPARLASNI
ncbi:MAG: hypothetical protein H7Z76_11710 [Methylotenera sp.]|nr:hypothetical protein [Flavobacterium sp.]